MINEALVRQIRTAFSEQYGGTPLLVRSPGRINFLGEHIDYNHGFCLPAAIEQAIYFAISPSPTHNSTLYSIDRDESYDSSAEQNPAWSRYLTSILGIIEEKNLHYRPFQGVIGSDLPIGAGLSSSAALCCGFIYALDDLNGWNLSKRDIALMAQAAEHRVGIKCGLMDQFGVLFGKKDHLLLMDCVDLSYKLHPMDLQGHHLALINSNVSHDLADSAYNHRRTQCEMALEKIRAARAEISTFRDLAPELLSEYRSLITSEQFDFLQYVIGEIQRVRDVVNLISSPKVESYIAELGSLLFETHAGLQDLYQVTCRETDLLVTLARQTPGFYGARQMGGGFGGCVLYLCDDEGLELLPGVLEEYKQRTEIASDCLEVALEDGVRAMTNT